MADLLFYFPGQQATFTLEIFNSDGYRFDGYVDGYEPTVDRVFGPLFTEMDGYLLGQDGYFPQPMKKIDTGLYTFKLTIPKGAASIGSYLVDVSYTSLMTTYKKQKLYQIVVTSPFGNFSATT